MKTAEEVFLSVLEKELDFVSEDKLKSTARALVDRLSMENVKFFDISSGLEQPKVFDMDLTMEDILLVKEGNFFIDTFYVELIEDYFKVLGEGPHNSVEIAQPDYIRKSQYLRQIGEHRAQYIPEALNKVCAAIQTLRLKNTYPMVYDMYQDRLREEREEKSFYENPCK